MAVPLKNVSAPGYHDVTEVRTDVPSMVVAIVLFFMIGVLTCLNDIIIPHLKSIFTLDYRQAMMVQFAFFSSYFLFSWPSGWLVEKVGYKRSMVVGLLVMALGAAGFVPAARFAEFGIFLAALLLLAAGMTVCQVAANPYVTVIGPARTASSRLNLVQAFNSIGTVIAPLLGSILILGVATPETPEHIAGMTDAMRQLYRTEQAASVKGPYIAAALLLAILATAISFIRLRTDSGGAAENTQDFRPGAFAEAFAQPDSIWRHPWLLLAALGIFTYVGAEVTIGSLLVSFMGLKEIAAFPEALAARYLMLYWGGTMAGRFVGSAILQRVRTGLLLGLFAVCACALVVAAMLDFGHTAMWALIAVGFFNSIMFPSIFTLGIQDLGYLTSKGSSLMIAAIVGGALIPLATGRLADSIGLHHSFILTAVCYVYIAFLGFASLRRPPAHDSRAALHPHG